METSNGKKSEPTNLSQLPPLTNQPPEKNSESSVSGSSKSNSTAKDAAAIAKQKLAEKKNGRGRPVGSVKSKPGGEKKPEAEQTPEVKNLAARLNITPQFAATIYKHIVNGYARSLKADLLTAQEVKEFEEQYREWIALENFKIDPLWMARIGMITAVGMPIIIRHPLFEKLLLKFAGDLAEQNNDSIRPEGPRENDLHTVVN